MGAKFTSVYACVMCTVSLTFNWLMCIAVDPNEVEHVVQARLT